MVVVDEAAEHRAGNDAAFTRIRVRGLRRQVLQCLMRPALVIVPVLPRNSIRASRPVRRPYDNALQGGCVRLVRGIHSRAVGGSGHGGYCPEPHTRGGRLNKAAACATRRRDNTGDGALVTWRWDTSRRLLNSGPLHYRPELARSEKRPRRGFLLGTSAPLTAPNGIIH